MSVLPLREAKDSLAKASTPEPFSSSRTSNWVARGGGLPAYVQHIAHDLIEKRGMPESRAIGMAVGIVKRWARGGGNVDATTRAAAAKAVAEWEALKAKNAAKGAAKAVMHSAVEPTMADELALREMALTRVAMLERTFGGVDGLICLLERDVLQEDTERSAQVDALGEMLWMDLATLSGQDIPPLARAQEARRLVPLAEDFHPGELRGFHGRWVKGGSHGHTPSMAALLTPPSVPGGGVSRAPKSLAARVTPRGPSVARTHSTRFQRYEGGARAFVSAATHSRMLGMFTKEEEGRGKPPQRTSSLKELYAQVPAAQKRLEDALRHVQAALNLDDSNFHDVDKPGGGKELGDALKARPHQAHIILGPTKKLEEAEKKVNEKYKGDASRITDVTRATVAVPHADDLPGAVASIREALPDGWSIHKPENRYTSAQGGIHNGDVGGYRDIAVLLVDPQGFVHELQINTTHMNRAKNGEGHKLYEQLRELKRKVDARDGVYTRQEAALRRSLDRQGRQLYEAAMVRSTSPAARLAPRSPLR